ncbi:VanZ family protein [Microbacter sp. GSS18]|nr:VanZ family protein [Microbacter sp. GSS18]
MLAAATAVYVAVVASLTLGPQPEAAGGGLEAIAAWLGRFSVTAWVTFPVLEFAANVVLFLPAGVIWVLWAGGRRWWLAALAGLALSTGIELTQAVALADRVPDARDLVANTLGALAGAGAVAGTAARAASPRAAEATR